MAISLLDFDYRQFLKWGLANLHKVDDLMRLVQSLAAATSWKDRWDVLYEIGNLFLASTPPEDDGISIMAATDVETLESELVAKLAGDGFSVQAWDGSRLRKIWDTLGPFLPILIELIKAR